MEQAKQRQIRQRLTYANVISSLALFLVLSGGAAFAASKIGSGNIKANAVKSKQLARNSVTSAKIAPGAVKTSDIAFGSIGAQQLAANSVDGSKVPDGSLSPSDLSNPPAPVLGVTPVTATTVATATGGPVTVPTGGEEEEEEEEEGEEEGEEGEEAGAAQISLTGGTFTQGAQQNIIYLAQMEATLSAEEGEECGIELTVNVDGEPLGPTIPANLPAAPEEEEGEEEEGEEEEGEEEEGEEEAPGTPADVTQGRVLGPNLATGTAQPRVMTAEAIIGEDAVCESAEVKSLKIVALGVG